MFQQIHDLGQFEQIIGDEVAVLAYFSTDECNVCKILKPKIGELIQKQFPEIKLLYVNISETPDISAQQRIFSVPTICIYFDSKESIRKSRNISVSELEVEISRPYSILFS